MNKKKSLWMGIQYLCLLLSSLIILKLNLLNFGPKIYGIWILLSAIWGFGSSLDFGFSTSTIKFVSQFYNKGSNQLNYLLSTSLFIFFLSGIIIFIIGNIAGNILYFTNQITILEEEASLFRITFIILGISFYIQYIIIFCKAIMEGTNEFILLSKVNILQSSFFLISVIFVYLYKLSIIEMAFLYVVSSFIIFIIVFLIIKKKFPQFRFTITHFRFSIIKKIFVYSFSVQVSTILNALIDPIIKYLIGNYYNITLVPVYEIARRFAVAISGLFFTMFRPLLPKASILLNKNDSKNFIMGEVLQITKFGVVYSGVIFGIFSFLIILFMRFIFGYEVLTIVFLVLSLPEAINNSGYSIYIFLLGIGKAIFLAFLQFINLVMTIIFLLLGFNLFNSPIGLLGYFISVLVGNSLMFYKLKKEFDIEINLFIQLTSMKKLMILVLFLLTSTVLVNYNVIYELYILVSLSFLTLVFFLPEIVFYSKRFSYDIKKIVTIK
jgi:O-antigen/teichoic acid export membrane protein